MTASVLFVMPHLSFGGAERLFTALIRDLAARQVRSLVAVASHNRKWLDSADPWFAPICPVHRLAGAKDLAGALIELIVREDVGTVVIGGRSPAFHALPRIAGALPDVRVVSFQFNAVESIRENRHNAPFIDLVIAESLEAARALSDEREALPPVRVIPSGVDVAAIRARERGAREGGRINVAYVGRFDRAKNPLDFVRMAALLNHGQARLEMAGDGPLLAKARGLARSSRLGARMRIRGFLDDDRLAVMMDAIDILVVPSRIDGHPLVIQEAQARGVPVVATRVGDIPDLVRDEVTGLLCPPGEPAALAKAVTRLLDDAALRQRLGEAGAARALLEGDLAISLPLYASAILGASSAPARPTASSGCA